MVYRDDTRRSDSGRRQEGARDRHGYELQIPVQSCERPIMSAEGFFQAACTAVISRTGGCHVVTPSGHTITLHRRQRTFWLKDRISTGRELEVVTIAAVRTSPEVQGLPVVAQDPGDEQGQEAANSSDQPV